ncbi:prephenate dehydratase [Phytophthora pseudosyringae]|uniref:Prephenate dehydratase n=1 Tax=Phytophthora pseudosyringae TaxID=221518 RepID=A0A8T1V8E4_9STRA|nr:prephenate dehydratase [Phytophthora pseudosyringae]
MGAELKITYEGGEAGRAARHFVDNSALAVAYKCAEDACAAVTDEEGAVFTPEQEADPTTYTRFLLLPKKKYLALDEKIAGVSFKTSLVFGFKDSTAKGMFNRALTVSQRDRDLTKVESRPWDGQEPQQHGEKAVDTSTSSTWA